MLKLDRKKLESSLSLRGENLSQLARSCGMSRQSLYEMFEGKSIFSTPFEKLLGELMIPFGRITVDDENILAPLHDAPLQVRRVVLSLQRYAVQHNADLFLFGSRARGKKGIRADWDFALFFPSGRQPKSFASLKINAEETAFPYRVDVLCLNDAPAWFLNSVSSDALRLHGVTDPEIIFQRRAA